MKFSGCFICKRLIYIPIILIQKQGPQGPEELSSLKSLNIQNPHRNRAFLLLQPTEMASLSNSGWQNRKERQNRSSINGDIVERDVN